MKATWYTSLILGILLGLAKSQTFFSDYYYFNTYYRIIFFPAAIIFVIGISQIIEVSRMSKIPSGSEKNEWKKQWMNKLSVRIAIMVGSAICSYILFRYVI
jgi:hypothetical protein